MQLYNEVAVLTKKELRKLSTSFEGTFKICAFAFPLKNNSPLLLLLLSCCHKYSQRVRTGTSSGYS